MKVNYKGYTISQASNNHIMITKDNEVVFHASLSKKLNEEELKAQIDWFIEFFYKMVKEKMEEK